uniref:MADS-box transcription factor n=1 Tax=Solanum tuberosum TaxID=4113 RepID=M1DVC5_SOLTU
MGRKIEIKKIEDIIKRQVTFSKRRSSLLKKAKEIAISCDVDVLLVAFSPANRLSKFCSQNRPVSSPLATTGTHLNNPSESGLEYAHSNSNRNLSNNNNIIQQNEHSLFQSDAITPNIHGFNYPREENTMGSNEYFADTTYENDAWDVFLNEALNGEDF